MPFKQINETQIYYEEAGTGPETIVFSHGLLMNGDMFSEQVKAFINRPCEKTIVSGPVPASS